MFSFIVPVFNRPDEVDELLASLCKQTEKSFEVIIVEDGSQQPCKEVCDRYADQLDLKYFMKENSGPGQSRNYGAARAQGDYLIILVHASLHLQLPLWHLICLHLSFQAGSQIWNYPLLL